MAYASGELLVVTGKQPKDEYPYDEWEGVHDSRGLVDNLKYIKTGAYLPHSCDYWVIGGIEEINALMADLLQARHLLTTSTTNAVSTL